ncbi:hypothetical protein AQUCO_01000348v1 [Aquilegia coerulea]|nr:hypothetical protein AQUCO_01000348v1 [Aquilegia coerulea]
MATFEAIGEGVPNKFIRCFKDGTWSSILGGCTIVRDFADVSFHSYFSVMDVWLESKTETPTEIKISQIPGCTLAGILGLFVDVPIIIMIVIYKAPFMLFKGWHRLVRDLIGRSGPFLETVCVPFAGLSILLWPIVVALASLAGIGSSFFLGLYAAVVAYQENSTKRGLLYIIAILSLFDEYTNDFLYLQEGSCFPRPRYREVVDYSVTRPTKRAPGQSEAVRTKQPPVRMPSKQMQALKAVVIWNNFFQACEYTGRELLGAGAIGMKDLEAWQYSKSDIVNIGIPAYTFFMCFLRSIKSGSTGFLMRDNIELTDVNRPEGRVFDWLFEPMSIMKEQIKSLHLTETEELYLYKLSLYCGNRDRVDAWNNGGVPPVDEIRRAQLHAISRRLRGFSAMLSRLPTFRRRFQEVVKALAQEAKQRNNLMDVVRVLQSMELLNPVYLTTIFSGVFVLIYFLYIMIRSRRTNAKIRTAPEPAGAWPLIGHLPMLSEPGLPHIVLGDWADKYGPAFTIRFGMHKALVVSSWEVAKECFTTNDKALASRPTSVAIKIMACNGALFGFAPYGKYWREARKIAILELLSNHRLELLKHVRISEVSTSIKELYQVWQESCNSETGSALVEMKPWFGDLTLNVVVRMVAGKRYFGSSVKLDNGEGKRLQKVVHDFFHLVGLFVVSDAVPFLGAWFDFKGYEKAMKRTAKELDNIMEGWLQEHRRNKLEHGTNVEQDFMYVLLSILDENDKFYGYEADLVNKAICVNMIFGGVDTTTVTLTWALSLLLNNRDILQKAQHEIDSIVGKDRLVDESDITKLVYLQAIVKETLRLYPAAPLSAQHLAMEDCTVSGYHVRAGTWLFTNIYKIQRDPRVWSSPSEFQPERFLTTQANVDFRGKHFEFVPFGSGRRSCPGMSFALQVVYLTLARLLQGFDFETPLNATCGHD